MTFKLEKIYGLVGSRPTLHYVGVFRRTSKAFGILAALIGALAIFGWIKEITFLKSVFPGFMAMKINTAVCFILSGTSLLFLQESDEGKAPKQAQFRFAALLISVVVLLGVITLCEYIFRTNLGIDQLISGFLNIDDKAYVGRMPPNVAFNFVLIGISLMTLDYETRRGFRPAQLCALIVGVIGLLAFVGYIYGEKEIIGFAANTKMAFNASIAFLLLFGGLISMRPTAGVMVTFISDSYEGFFVRLAMPLAILFSVVYGFVILEGERAGYYDAGFRLAVICTTGIAGASIFVYIIARLLGETELSNKRSSAKQDFLTFISHKLFTPLSIIIGTLELLGKGAYGAVTEEMKVAVKVVNESAIKMKLMIGKMLTLSEINKKDLQLSREDIELLPEISRAMNAFISLVSDKKVNLSFQCKDKNVRLKLNRQYFELMIQNLIENAIKFNDKEEVDITCKLEKFEDKVQISISDNGPGIPKEEIDNIFKGFYQIEKNFTGSVEGLGVGLSLVKKLAEVHGGEISVDSTPGKGSTFRITLPVNG